MHRKSYHKLFLKYTDPASGVILYEMMNRLFFADTLPPVDMICKKLKTKSDSSRIFVNADFSYSGSNSRPEIRIDPDSIIASSPGSSWEQIFFHLCGCLLHEMVHFYCRLNDIQDVDYRRQYHTKEFKKAAEEHGLEVYKAAFEPSLYGYNMTYLSKASERMIIKETSKK